MADKQVPGGVNGSGGAMKDRWEQERSFMNEKVTNKPSKSYYSVGFNAPMVQELLNSLGDIRGRKVLEIGCGNGWLTCALASRGAEVFAFDISDEAIKAATETLERSGLSRSVHLAVMSVEELEYADDSFDIVIGNAILHHLDVERSLRQVHRVLKPGGRAVFLEPLGGNPLLNLFRALTPSMRTRNEEPLKKKHFAIAAGIFPNLERRDFYLLALLALPFFFVGWEGLMFWLRDVLLRVDDHLLRWFPSLGNYCWYSLLTLGK